jgi:outer membrane biogenesis lipoprotein LolB
VYKKFTKGILIAIIASFSLTACTSTTAHNKVIPPEKQNQVERQDHNKKPEISAYAKKIKKLRNEKAKKNNTKDFCFKDNRSIHYKACEKCK